MAVTRAEDRGFGWACALALALAIAGCSSPPRSGGGEAGAGGSGVNAGKAGSLSLDDPSTVAGTNSSGGSAPIEACAGELTQAERAPLDIYIMLDVSGSMLNATVSDPGVTKWRAVSSALSEFVKDPLSEGIGIGLQLFPVVNHMAPASCSYDRDCGSYGPCLNHGCWPKLDGELVSCIRESDCSATQACKTIGVCSNAPKHQCDASIPNSSCGVDPVAGDLGTCMLNPSICLSSNDCQLASYETPAEPIATLPLRKDELLSMLSKAAPEESGLTPTEPALTGAINLASSWALSHSDHEVVALLATDGVPTLKTSGSTCAMVSGTADIDAVVGVASTGRAATPSISTFVIGVLGPDDSETNAPDILDAIAQAGGTDRAFIVSTTDDVQARFRAALDEIRGARLACDLKVPAPGSGKKLDYGQVNVQFNDGSGDKTLGYVFDVEHCTQDGGWYYETDPAKQAPQHILTCPATCEAFQRTDLGSVKIELGCQTKVVVK